MHQQDNSTEPDSPQRLARSRSHRLRTAKEFKACYDEQRAGDEHLLLFATASGLPYPRAGVSVSKKHGNAVERNRRKRLLRETFRLQQHELPVLDYVLIPRQSRKSTLQEYTSSLRRLSQRLERRLRKRGALVQREHANGPSDNFVD